MVVVAPGEPGVPVVWICASADAASARTEIASVALRTICFTFLIGITLLG
jgi:hypothetical protein